MQEQYKRTFWGMQLLIGGASISIWLWAHVLPIAALFFVTMQIAAIIGAAWAARLKRKIERHSAQTLLRQTPQVLR